MTTIKRGSVWISSDYKSFVVIGTMLVEGKSWVHYRLSDPKDHSPSEFSCYEESFLARFREQPE
jgi:hypothetical protein